MNVGDTIDLITEWRATVPADYPTITRVLTDPTTLTCVVRSPAGVTTTYTYPATITRASVGVFYARHVVNESGQWSRTWTGTGTAAGVDTKTFQVK